MSRGPGVTQRYALDYLRAAADRHGSSWVAVAGIAAARAAGLDAYDAGANGVWPDIEPTAAQAEGMRRGVNRLAAVDRIEIRHSQGWLVARWPRRRRTSGSKLTPAATSRP